MSQLGGFFIPKYESPQQTITAGGGLTLAHGLGVKPTLVFCEIVCITAEGVFSIGDTAIVPIGLYEADAHGVGVYPDATNLNIRFGDHVNVFLIFDKTNGAAFNIAPTKWKFVIRAWVL